MDERELFQVTKETLDGYRSFINFLKEENEELKKKKNVDCEEIEQELDETKQKLKKAIEEAIFYKEKHKEYLENVYANLSEAFSDIAYTVGSSVAAISAKDYQKIKFVLEIIFKELVSLNPIEGKKE